MGIGETLYSDSQQGGHIFAWIGAIGGSVIGIILIIVGISFVFHKAKYTKKVSGQITNDPNCNRKYTDKNNVTFDCPLIKVEYHVDGKTYNKDFEVSDGSIDYQKDNNINIFYEPANPEKASLSSDNTKVMGWILIIIGIFMIISGWVWLWLTYKSKFIASAVGVAGAANLISSAVRF